MTQEGKLLQGRFFELLRWERIKRREGIVVTGFFYSFLAALIAWPAREHLPFWVGGLSLPPLLFFGFVAAACWLRPWGNRESLRTVFLLDKVLHLQELAVTAWEILNRKGERPTELLVVREASERLREVDPKVLFKRRYSWHAFLALPLFLVWLLMVSLDVTHPVSKGIKGPRLTPLTQQLREFSRDVRERAKAQELAESLKVALALEEAVERSVRGEMAEKKLTEYVADIANRLGHMFPVGEEESEPFFAAATREALQDLKAELEALKSSLPLRDSAEGERRLGEDIFERLPMLPRLKAEIGRGRLSTQRMQEEDVSRLLDKLERNTLAELDRRTLLEIREFLDLLLKGGEGKEGNEALLRQGQTEKDSSLVAERARGGGNLPGNQPGERGEIPETPPPLRAGAATHLKGLLGEGKSGSLTLRGEPSGQQSKIPQEEPLTSYLRQAEEELASERIPERLKETIKRYFLSLGMTGEKNKQSAISDQPSGEIKRR